MAVTGEMNVQLHGGGAKFSGAGKRGECILRSFARCAAVGNDLGGHVRQAFGEVQIGSCSNTNVGELPSSNGVKTGTWR